MTGVQTCALPICLALPFPDAQQQFLHQFARLVVQRAEGLVHQQQRTALARALANSPRMLLMDEPFGALDHQTRELMQELLLGIWEAERKTVLFVTHDIDEAVFMGSRVVVMSARPGRIKLDRAVPLAHPRHYSVKTSPEFMALKAELTEQVRVEVRAAQAAQAAALAP